MPDETPVHGDAIGRDLSTLRITDQGHAADQGPNLQAYMDLAREQGRNESDIKHLQADTKALFVRDATLSARLDGVDKHLGEQDTKIAGVDNKIDSMAATIKQGFDDLPDRLRASMPEMMYTHQRMQHAKQVKERTARFYQLTVGSVVMVVGASTSTVMAILGRFTGAEGYGLIALFILGFLALAALTLNERSK